MAAVCLGLWGGGNWLVWKRVGRQAFPTAVGELQINGLSESVQIERDARGIPHIAAADESDAWAGLGFVHAQDRLLQMLWLRRMARGRTAEVVGEVGLAADRLARTLGIGRLADAEADRASEDVRAALDAYATGVNARMDRIRYRLVGPPRDLPPQDAALEAWTAGDSLAVAKLLAWAVSPEPETQVVLEALLERLGSVGARPFFPTGKGVQGISLPFAHPDVGQAEPVPDAVRAGRRAEVELASVALHATAWALASDATAGGAPLVGVDFHLVPTTPALLYEAYVKGGPLDVAGVTVPGLPVFWAGRNADVAWAASPARVVSADLYREKVRPPEAGESGPGFYLQGQTWRALELRDEQIRVAQANGSLRSERLAVLATRHGPLLESASLMTSAPGDRDPLAIRWTGFEPGNGVAGLLGVMRARTGAEVRAALERHHEPVIALLYADRGGEVAVQMAGWLPRKMLPTGVLPVSGQQLGLDWRAPLALDEFPAQSLEIHPARKRRGRSTRPAARWLVVADGPRSSGSGGIEWLWRSGEDAARLERALESLTSRGKVELWEAAAMQRDLSSGVSREVVEAVLSLAGDAAALGSEAREVCQILDDWNGELRTDSPGATVYRVFLDHLLKSLFVGPIGPRLFARYLDLADARPGSIGQAVLLAAAGREAPGGWAEREPVERAVRSSLQRASRTLAFRFGPKRERWIWGEQHPIVFAPLTPRSAVASRGEPLTARAFSDSNGVSSSGGISGFLSLEPGELFRVRTVTVARLLIDLSDRSRLLSVLAPGQSEHPGHPHFADGMESWRGGQHRRLAMSPFLVGEATVERLVLRPRR